MTNCGLPDGFVRQIEASVPPDGAFTKSPRPAGNIGSTLRERNSRSRKSDRAAYLECGDSGARINLVTVSGARLWGIIDAAGRAIIEPRYRAILCFRGGVAWVPDDDKRQWCPAEA